MKKLLTSPLLWIAVLLIALCCAVTWYLKYRQHNMVTEERTLFLASPEYLRGYKKECLSEGGTFCAKVVHEGSYSGANPYSDTLTNTEYLITCTKPKRPKSTPACVAVP